MRNTRRVLFFLAGCILLALLSAGCSDNGQDSNVTTVPTTATAAKFTTGDIIAKTATATDTMWLVVKYDAATDKYERASVKKKPDGTFYREDGRTDLLSRATIEKLYPVKVSHVSSLSQVPVLLPATVTTTQTGTVTTTPTTPYPAPAVGSIIPNTGLAGTTVSITSLTGTDFRAGATVKLVNGTSSIQATGVVVRSSSNITCILSLPSTTTAGIWNVTVTNSDGRYGTLANGFTITNVTTTTQPTTTATTAPPSPTVSGITPSSATTGIQVNITNLAGSNLLNITSVKLTRSGQPDISATNVSVVSSSQVTCTINLAGAPSGQWNVLVTNSGALSGIGTNMFTVNAQAPVASFSATPLLGNSPLPVVFTDQSTGSPATWSWTFGDGNTSTMASPSHTYAAAGIFTVSLTVSNSGGSHTITIPNYINVSWSTG